MKNGNFAVYKSIEYKFSSKGGNQILLMSNDSNDLKRGFGKSIHPGSYIKTVSRDEVDDAYSIFTFGIYKGHQFGIRAEEDGKVCIEGSGNENLMVSLDMDLVDRGVYRKWVKKDELEQMWEEKTPILQR